MNWEQAQDIAQMSTGAAGAKNWLVRGIRRTVMEAIGMSSLRKEGGMRYSQNVARDARNAYSAISAQVCLRERSLVNVRIGDKEKSRCDAA